MPLARSTSRTSLFTSAARPCRHRSSAPFAFLAAAASASSSFAASAARAASAAASSRSEISFSGSANASGRGTTNTHRCMSCTTAHALTVSPFATDASTGTRPNRNTFPGELMSSCASSR